jgi:hypothetical protein
MTIFINDCQNANITNLHKNEMEEIRIFFTMTNKGVSTNTAIIK